MLDIVVLNYNDAEQTLSYIHEIKNYESIDHIIVVDNCSTDNSYEKLLGAHDNCKIHVIKTNKNGGYGYGNNVGIKYAISNFETEYIAVSNPDVHYKEEAIKECCLFLQKNDQYAAVAPRMKNRNGAYMQCAWNISPWHRYITHQLIVIGRITRKKDSLSKIPENSGHTDCDCIAGSLFVIKTAAFTRAGMYDENMFLYCEETCLGMRFKRINMKEAVLNNYSFVHDHSVSISKTLKTETKRKRTSWDSRMYIMRNYYSLNRIQMAVCGLVRSLSIMEAAVVHFLKHRK